MSDGMVCEGCAGYFHTYREMAEHVCVTYETVTLDVVPALGVAAADKCTLCHALVGDREGHKQWHQPRERTVTL